MRMVFNHLRPGNLDRETPGWTEVIGEPLKIYDMIWYDMIWISWNVYQIHGIPSIPSYRLQADGGFLRKLSEFVGKLRTADHTKILWVAGLDIHIEDTPSGEPIIRSLFLWDEGDQSWKVDEKDGRDADDGLMPISKLMWRVKAPSGISLMRMLEVARDSKIWLGSWR